MLVDAHCHLDRYGDTLRSALKEIRQHKILTVSNSMDLSSYARNREIGQMCDLVLPTFGVHPWNAPLYVEQLKNLHNAIEQTPILGEIGLDHHFVEDRSQYLAQRKVFEFFLAAAAEQKKVVILHTKGAEKEVLHLLNSYDLQRVIVHWYSGPLDIFREFLARGSYFTMGVAVLRSEHAQAIARKVPSNQLLTETDNPGGLEGLTGQSGMPSAIRDVIHVLAELRKTTVKDIIRTIRSNFIRLTEDDPWLLETCAVLKRNCDTG